MKRKAWIQFDFILQKMTVIMLIAAGKWIQRQRVKVPVEVWKRHPYFLTYFKAKVIQQGITY
jgi:hypothetical protein